jgi:glycerol kinase
MGSLLAIDAGTTGVRTLRVTPQGQIEAIAYRELTQSYPYPGWVEHDGEEIWRLVVETLVEASEGVAISAIGITNQRETVIPFDLDSGQVLAPAPVWQDKRTAQRCRSLSTTPLANLVRQRTGLVLDPYFSATKMSWLLEAGKLDGALAPALGTVDAWILWRLTGGVAGGTFATDPSNASRTMLYDLETHAYSPELSEAFGVPLPLLPEVRTSAGRFGTVQTPELVHLAGVPISGILGDQQAALFGQRCFSPGMAKASYGTGAFVLANAGATRPRTPEGLLCSVAWDLGEHGGSDGGFAYCVEGSAFIAGAAIQWLRDELGIIGDASELEALALSAPEGSSGLNLIPAFVGLGSPFWDESARGALVGITRGSGRAQLANATIDALAYEVVAITRAMETSGIDLAELRLDGGASVMDTLAARLSDAAGLRVVRPASLESTALGAAFVAGLGEGSVASLTELSESYEPEASFAPNEDRGMSELGYRGWLEALERSRNWV